MPETTKHAEIFETPATPEKYDIYDLYALSATSEFPDAAEIYEHAASMPFDAFATEAIADASALADAFDTDAADMADDLETPEILSRVDSLMMRRRNPASINLPFVPPPMRAAGPEAESVQEAVPETASGTSDASLENTVSESQALSEQTEQAVQRTWTREEAAPPCDAPGKLPAEDDDLPILTDIIPLEVPAPIQTALPTPDPDEARLADATVETRIAAQAARISQRITETLAADIAHVCSQRLARELPILLDQLLNSEDKALRSDIASLVENALCDALLAEHQGPDLTPDVQAGKKHEN